MGGNVKFYKEHLEQDFFKRKIPTVSCLRPQSKVSLSDQDSDPESLRYSRRIQSQNTVDVIMEEREAELSFDNYSTIYQPEFLLNVKSQPLIIKSSSKARGTRQVVETRDMRNVQENETISIAAKISLEEIKVDRDSEPSKPSNTVSGIDEQPVFDYDLCSYIPRKENTKAKEDKVPLRHNVIPCRKPLIIKENKFLESKPKKIEKVKKLVKSKILDKEQETEQNLGSNENFSKTNDILSMNINENSEENISLSFNKQNIFSSEDTFWYCERKINDHDGVDSRKEAEQFYPESLKAEANFFKTPCSTRYNSLESFTDLEQNEPEDTSKEVNFKHTVIECDKKM